MKRPSERAPKATFKLKCVTCKTVEERLAAECREQPYCNKCFSPMVLIAVRAR